MATQEEIAESIEEIALKIREGKLIAINHRFWREVIEKPIEETCGMYKEFKAAYDFHLELHLVNKR